MTTLVTSALLSLIFSQAIAQGSEYGPDAPGLHAPSRTLTGTSLTDAGFVATTDEALERHEEGHLGYGSSNGAHVRKCCPDDQIIVGYECNNASELPLSPLPLPDDAQLLYGFPQCPEYYPLEPHLYEEDNFVISRNGWLQRLNDTHTYSPKQYCIDHFHSEGQNRTQALVCFPEDMICTIIQYQVYPGLLLASCLVLAATLITFMLSPTTRTRLPGQLKMCLVSALLVTNLLLALSSPHLQAANISATLCILKASVLHFSSLASFFWLNVMCFDVWRTLRSMRLVSGSRCRLLSYSVYAWGVPLLVSSVAANMDVYDPYLCILRQDKTVFWKWLHGLVLPLVLANCAFFCLVVHLIYRSHSDPVLLQCRQQQRGRLCLYVKLFMVMGLTWLAEVASMAWDEPGRCGVWVVTDVINILQSFFIFLAFVSHKTTWNGCRARVSSSTESIKMSVIPTTVTPTTHAAVTTRVATDQISDLKSSHWSEN